MTLGIAFIGILLIAVAVGGISYVQRQRACAPAAGLHSLARLSRCCTPRIWVLAPALLVLAAWAPMQTRLVDQAVLSTPEGQALPDFEMQRDTILAEARQIAHREIEAGFNPESTALAPRVKEAEQPLRLDRRHCGDPVRARRRAACCCCAGAAVSSGRARPSSDG